MHFNFPLACPTSAPIDHPLFGSFARSVPWELSGNKVNKQSSILDKIGTKVNSEQFIIAHTENCYHSVYLKKSEYENVAYKTIIFPYILYGYEVGPVTLRVEHELQV
jgi:hypothetical protein